MQIQPSMAAAAMRATQGISDAEILDILANPVIILSAPRSGSTLLFEQLSRFDCFWTIGGESHGIFQTFPSLRTENADFDSMALSAGHASPEICAVFRRCFVLLMRNHQGVPFLSLPKQQRPTKIYMLEKTPRNALNIPFIRKVFPKARFIFQHRDPRQTVSSLMEAWTIGLQTGRFVTFRDLPDWTLPAWCFLLPRGWRELKNKPLAEIAAFQWRASNQAIIDGLAEVPRSCWTSIDYSALVEDPAKALGGIKTALELASEIPDFTSQNLPFSRTTVSPPHPDKWKRHKAEIDALWPMLSETEAQIISFCQPPELTQ